jgi:hypothetical protein
MTTALAIITDAYERLNRLSPGEVLSADDAAFGLRRLNLLVDELAAQPAFLFRAILTSAPQSGPITLGVGAWAAISPGDEIVSATANNLALSPITLQQYNELYQPNVTGTPTCWAQDGMGTVYLWPVPTGQTVKLMTRATVAAFADLTSDYTLVDGWTNALGASLAVRLAPTLLGGMPPELVRAESRAMGVVRRYQPAILNVDTYNRSRQVFPPRLF